MSWLSRLFNALFGANAGQELAGGQLTNYEPHKLVGVDDAVFNEEMLNRQLDKIKLQKEMAEYIILTQGWIVKTMGENGEKSKIIAADKTLITKQGVLTEELNKWIVDNYNPDGTLKLKTDNI